MEGAAGAAVGVGVLSVLLAVVVIVVGLVLVAGVAFVLWVWPITMGVREAKKKNYSPAWMLFGIHPIGGWVMFTVVHCWRPRIQCASCGGFVKDNFIKCPLCHEAVRRQGN